MAWMMRLLLLALGSLLSFPACAQAPEGVPSEVPRATARTQGYYARAASLQQTLLERPADALLDDAGQELVLQLAHAQTCLAQHTGDLGLAQNTEHLLDAYVELHREHGQQPSRRTRRKIEQTKQNIDGVRGGKASAVLRGCEPFRVRYTEARSDAPFRTPARSIDNGNANVPGGVIR